MKSASEDVVKSSMNIVDDVQIRTADIQQRFKFFETYKEPEKEKKSFRITPPREGQVKVIIRASVVLILLIWIYMGWISKGLKLVIKF